MQEDVSERRDDDSGFSLVEVVVAMVLLALLAMAVLPLILRATTAAAAGTTVATATSLVSREMELVRSEPLLTCPAGADVAGFPKITTDARGTQLTTNARYEFPTPCTEPGLVRYVVTVTRPAPAGEVASAATYLPVGTP